jgi:hypothetical protein
VIDILATVVDRSLGARPLANEEQLSDVLVTAIELLSARTQEGRELVLVMTGDQRKRLAAATEELHSWAEDSDLSDIDPSCMEAVDRLAELVDTISAPATDIYEDQLRLGRQFLDSLDTALRIAKRIEELATSREPGFPAKPPLLAFKS